ncbi:MFS transporter [Peptococcus simiae]|uniref:MFS transporter n=1 Tax=Peptococcus simiae TaxID=1643805 RepID=UPI00397EF172
MTFSQLLENKWLRAALPALLIHCSIGTVYCWSSFAENLAESLQVTSQVIGGAFSLAIFCLGISAAFAGPFIERNIHRASGLACLFFTSGLVGTGLTISLAPVLGSRLSLLGIYLFYGIIMGIGLGIGYLTPVKTLMLWFADHKGLGTGISIMGFGLAKAIASPLMNFLQDQVGLSTMFYILAGLYFTMMYAGHLLLKKPDQHDEKAVSDPINRLALFRSKTFLGIWLMFYLNISCGLALIAYEKPLLQTTALGLVAISLVQSLTAGANASGRLVLSTLSDRLADRNQIYKLIFFACLVVCGLGLSQVGGAGVIILMLVIVNTSYGGGFSTMPALLASRFGMTHVSTIHGVVLSAWAFAGLTGNQVAALILKHFGDYQPLFLCLALLYGLGFLISHFLVSPAKAPALIPQQTAPLAKRELGRSTGR